MKTRCLMALMFVLILMLTSCDQPVDEGALNTVVAATLEAIELPATVEPLATSAPSATVEVTQEPTPLPPTETPDTPQPLTDEDFIKAALSVYMGREIEPTTILVSDNTGLLARGGLQGAYFIAAKDVGTWIIVYAGQATPYCNLITPYGFPTAWIPECLADDDSLIERSDSEGPTVITALGPPTWVDTMDTKGRWYLLSTDNTNFKIEGGNLVMNALEAGGYDEWGVAAGDDQTDFYLELTAKTGGQCSGLDRYGVIFRVPDPSEGYIFEFSCDGRYRLYEWDGEKYTGLQGWKANSAILAGPNKENRQAVMVVGDQVKLYANDQLLGEYTIEDYPQGRFGLVVGSSDTDNFKVMIDSVSFWNLAN